MTAVTSVPRLWSGEAVVCLASGPSLTPEDVAYVRGKARVIAVNTTYKAALWADALYAADFPWWKAHNGAPDFLGMKWSIKQDYAKFDRFPDVRVLRNTGEFGLETDPAGLKTGKHSGAQAIGLAYHFGAARVLLLGYDCGASNGVPHWHGSHPFPLRNQPHYGYFLEGLEKMSAPLRAAGVEVINCSRQTAATCFPRAAVRDVLIEKAVAA